jgi:hypothetical protein
MEIASTALVSLACLLSSGKTDPQATDSFLKNLKPEQVVELQQIVESGACLPKKFENKVQPGVRPGDVIINSPTTDLM